MYVQEPEYLVSFVDLQALLAGGWRLITQAQIFALG